MKNNWNWLWALTLAMPAYAQDPAGQPPADGSTPAEQVPAGATPAPDSGAAPADSSGSVPYEAPPTDSSAAPAADGSAPADAAAAPASDTGAAPAAETPAEAPADRTPWHLYAGADWVRDTLSSSNLGGFGNQNYDSGMYRLRGGARLFDAIGAEFQLGLNRNETDSANSPAVKTKSYYGLFLVPTASVFETVELGFPIGYAFTKVDRPGASASLHSVAYGLNIELPLRVFSASLPNFRFGAGWMVYDQTIASRLYGLNAGLRYDFDVDGGNPFAAVSGMGDRIGGFFKSLWPFGGKDDAPK